MAGKAGMQGTKPRAIPERHSAGWLQAIDRRYKPAIVANAMLEELQVALGGHDTLSPQERALTERATWLHIRLQQIEQHFLAGHGLDAAEYAQLISSQLHVLKALGLKRQAKKVKRLSEILEETAQ